MVLVIGAARDGLFKPLAGPAQRYRASCLPDFAINKNGGTRRRRRLSRADDHRSTSAILGKGFNFQSHCHESAVAQFADAANGVARDTLAQACIFRRSRVSIGSQPFLDGKTVAGAVKH